MADVSTGANIKLILPLAQEVSCDATRVAMPRPGLCCQRCDISKQEVESLNPISKVTGVQSFWFVEPIKSHCC